MSSIGIEKFAMSAASAGLGPTSIESYDEGYETDAYQGTGEFAPGYEQQPQYDEGSYQETEQL